VAPAAGSAATAARTNPRTVRRRINLLSTSSGLYTANRVAVPPRASALQVREVKELSGWRRTVRVVCPRSHIRRRVAAVELLTIILTLAAMWMSQTPESRACSKVSDALADEPSSSMRPRDSRRTAGE
jgi:hypothetical protein